MRIGGMTPPIYEDDNFLFLVTPHKQCHEGYTASCWHEDLEFKLIHAGQTIVMLDSELLTAQTDELIFINPYQIHSMPVMEGNDRYYSLFMVNLDFFQKCGIQCLNLRKLFMQDHIQIRSHIQNPRLIDILKKILDANEKLSKYSKTLIQGLLIEFFSILLTEEVSDTVAKETSQDSMRYCHAIAPAIEIIHTHYNEKLSDEDLATACKMSLYYFCRVFKRVMGVTPVQYQTEYRLRIADMLLRNGQFSVSTIANMIGYEDATYFSRCYKKHRGISPRQKKNSKYTPEIMG